MSGNNTKVEAIGSLEFITYEKNPTERKVIYASFISDHRPLKDEKWRIFVVVGGNKLTYVYNFSSPATDLIKTKILLNSIIPDAKSSARFLSMDLKDMFLHTPIEQPKYMKVPINYFPDNIEEKYHLETLEHIYQDKIGMYGLNQYYVLAYQQ